MSKSGRIESGDVGGSRSSLTRLAEFPMSNPTEILGKSGDSLGQCCDAKASGAPACLIARRAVGSAWRVCSQENACVSTGRSEPWHPEARTESTGPNSKSKAATKPANAIRN